MLAGFLLALREGIEAALIISIVLGMLKKMNRYDRAPVVWLGVAGAVLLSVATAIILGVIGAEFEGAAEQAFEGFTMLFAAAVLTWMIFWMQKQGRQIQKGLEAEVREALSGGQTVALFSVAFFAVLREGIELALFLTAVNFSSPAVGEAPILGWLGGVLGLDRRDRDRVADVRIGPQAQPAALLSVHQHCADLLCSGSGRSCGGRTQRTWLDSARDRAGLQSESYCARNNSLRPVPESALWLQCQSVAD